MEKLYIQSSPIRVLYFDGLGQVLENHSLCAKSSPLPDFVNQASLGHRPCSLIYVLLTDAPHSATADPSCGNRLMGHKAKDTYYLAHYRKSLPVLV